MEPRTGGTRVEFFSTFRFIYFFTEFLFFVALVGNKESYLFFLLSLVNVIVLVSKFALPIKSFGDLFSEIFSSSSELQ